MKIQFLNGGLANQVFQYIFLRYAELSHPDDEPWFLDDSFFFVKNEHNGYELERVFNIKANLLSSFFEPDVWGYMMEQKRAGKSVPQLMLDSGMDISMISEFGNYDDMNPFKGAVEITKINCFTPEIIEKPGNIYYHGYWIIKDYFNAFRTQLLEELSFPPLTEIHNIEYMKQIEETQSLSVHIRRGDFVTLGWDISPDIYKGAINAMHEAIPDTVLFVFSDDIGWCKENAEELGLNIPDEAIYIEGNKGLNDFRDLQLLSRCKNSIIAGSSFNYLAALINPNLDRYLNLSARVL